jgi:predicted ArsR family transcriptional regulator
MKRRQARQSLQRASGTNAWLTMALLERGEGCSQAELVAHLGVSQPSVSALLLDLEELGLVSRVGTRPGTRGRPSDRWRTVESNAEDLRRLGERLASGGASPPSTR